MVYDFVHLQCATSLRSHYLTEPVRLVACEHSACRRCLPEKRSSKVKCKICGKISNRGEEDVDAVELTCEIEQNLGSLRGVVQNETTKRLGYHKELLEKGRQKIGPQIQFAKEEIEIRIESLKAELDVVREKMYEELDKIESSITAKMETKCRESENEVMECEEKVTAYELTFAEFQNELTRINEIIENIENCSSYQVVFETSVDTLGESFVGKLRCKNMFKSSDDIENMIENDKYELIPLNVEPFETCVLPNDTLLTANSSSLTVYDENFKELRRITQFDEKTIDPRGVVMNQQGQLYILDVKSRRVIMTDEDFTLLKVYESTEGTWRPTGISYHEDYLYVADQENKLIYKFFSDLEVADMIKVDYNPWLIKICGKMACIATHVQRQIYFHDLSTFELKRKYDHGEGRISVINSNFYLFADSPRKIYIYNIEGELVKEIKEREQLRERVKALFDGLFFCYNDKVYMQSYNTKSLLVLK